jgi:hypothetical protein
MGYCIGADHDKQCICSPPDDRLPRFPGFYCFSGTDLHDRLDRWRDSAAGLGITTP